MKTTMLTVDKLNFRKVSNILPKEISINPDTRNSYIAFNFISDINIEILKCRENMILKLNEPYSLPSAINNSDYMFYNVEYVSTKQISDKLYKYKFIATNMKCNGDDY